LTSDFSSSFPNREDPSASTHSFIVKIWLEEIRADGKPVWRGHITHVPSNRKEYFISVENVPTIISSYLQIDDPPGGASKKSALLHWLKRLTPRISQKIGRNASRE
jgi:hypothetical protein